MTNCAHTLLSKTTCEVLGLLCGLLTGLRLNAEVPSFINYQGRVIVSRTNFEGNGLFKFALVNGTAANTFWSNDGTSVAGSEPVNAVPLAVSKGLYSVRLGDATLANMAPLPSSVFVSSDVRLRVWFNDGAHGSQLLSPDQRIGSVAYALQADSVGDGSITAAKLAPEVISSLVGPLSAQLAALTARVNSLTNQVGLVIPNGLTCASSNPLDPGLKTNGFQLFSALPAPPWITSPALSPPQARHRHTALWTGQELLVWGGVLGNGQDSGFGGSYRPAVDEWQAISTVNSPTPRSQHAAVWSGQEMIVWGGVNGGNYLNTGARFNPSSQTWTPITTQSAPSGRAGHVAVWAGTQMFIWGGQNSGGLLGDGAMYDPVQDKWSQVITANAPAPRAGAKAAWTGAEVVIWGGEDSQGSSGSGGRLGIDPSGQQTSWQPIIFTGAPLGRSDHAAVWTGSKLLVWGGINSGTFLGDGALYDPTSNSWTAISTNNAPTPRSGSIAVWSGQELLVHGGETGDGTANDGSAYNPGTDSWRTLTPEGNPVARSGGGGAWSGTELLVFGGLSNGQPIGSLQRLNPQPPWYLFRKP